MQNDKYRWLEKDSKKTESWVNAEAKNGTIAP
jgi:hypothetical protein